MPITQYLCQKYGFYDNAQAPTEFLCEELLLDESEVTGMLKRMLPRGQWRWEMMYFNVFCCLIDEVLDG